MATLTSQIYENMRTYKLTPPRYSLFLPASAPRVPPWRAIYPGAQLLHPPSRIKTSLTSCSKKLPGGEFFAGTASGRKEFLLRSLTLGRALGTPARFAVATARRVNQNCFSPHKGGWRTHYAILLPAFADKYRFSLFQ